MTGYAYDQDHLERTAALLYGLIPEFYKRRDRAADSFHQPELRALVEAMAAPLATMRQSIEELHGDLFVDSAGDEMLAEFAASIALELVFRDAEANRRDLRAAMVRRRRKGTPAMLEEMARTLLDRQVVTREGWKAVQIAQDLDIQRLARTVPDLRSPSIAERVSGSLATIARTVDPRPITLQTGHAHPRHMVHWAFLTRLQPLRNGACRALEPGPSDLRFVFDAAGAWLPLRVRSTGIDDRPGTDRVPEGLFAERPGDWHGQDGRFTVRLTGLPAAAVCPADLAARKTSRVRAHVALVRLPVEIELIETDGACTSGSVEVKLIAAPLAGDLPDMTALLSRGTVTIDATGIAASTPGAGMVADAHAILLHTSPATEGASCILGETVLALTGGTPQAQRSAEDADLAASGYRRGALHLRLPEMLVEGERWFYLGADGSLHDAANPGSPTPDRPLLGGLLPERAAVSAPVGPVWPEAIESGERRPFMPPLAAPAAAPVPVHGLTVMRESGLSQVPAAEASALVLALTHFADRRRYDPMLRLSWTGSNPRSAVWEAIDAGGQPLAGNAVAARFSTLAELLAEGRSDLAVALRFECERSGALLTPGELAFTAIDGRAVLIHLPELRAGEPAEANWPLGPAPLARRSLAVEVGSDGSTWEVGTNRLARSSLGPEVPLLAPVAMRRREAAWRRLCPWMNEIPPLQILAPTLPGQLDIDPRFGLFAIASAEAPVPHPAGPIAPPSPVTVDMEVGATMELGALPIDHGRILNRAPRTPTRLVSASGHLGRGTDPEDLDKPLHHTLAEALTAIAADGAAEEIVRIVDSGFYGNEALTWPAGPEHLIVEVAAGERPVLEIASSATAAGTGYNRLELLGLALLPRTEPLDFVLPPAQETELAFVSVFSRQLRLRPRLREAAGAERLTIRRSVLGPVQVEEEGRIEIADSILDSGDSADIVLNAPSAHLLMDRSTVDGWIDVEEVDVSDSILAGRVKASERFRGCIRFSLLAPDSDTPRKHRVVWIGDDTEPPFLSRARRDPAYLRLDPTGDARILTGASNGGEMGAFNIARLGELVTGVTRRLAEHTPAGLRTGLVLQH